MKKPRMKYIKVASTKDRQFIRRSAFKKVTKKVNAFLEYGIMFELELT